MSASDGIQPWFWLRTTGFPFAWLDDFRCAEAAEVARRVAELDAELEAQARALADEIAAKFPQGNDKLTKAVGRIQPLAPGALPSAPRWNELCAQKTEARTQLEAVLAPELLATRRALHAHHADDKVREAIFLSTRQALTMFDSMRQEPLDAKRASKTRYREVEAFLFLQRLCSKNETVSFYGPIGWGTTARDREQLEFVPGSGRHERRVVSFEYWAAQALALAVNADAELHDDLPVRLNPTCRVDGEVLYYPLGQKRAIDARTAKLLSSARGQPLRAFLDEVGAQASELQPLLQTRILERGVFLPTMVLHPEERLLEALLTLAPSVARDRWVTSLKELLADRDAYAHANLEERATILMRLDERFQTLTGKEATRGEGQMYVGRALLYEDCMLDAELRLGRAATERLERSLRKTVEICRWVVRHVAGALHQRASKIWQDLGQGEVDFLVYSSAARALLEDTSLLDETRAELSRAWQKVIGSHAAAVPEIALEESHFDAVLAALPEPPRTGPFLGESIHSPDVILSARGPEALKRGEFEIVLGEIHKMVYYEAHPVGWPFCPARDEVTARLKSLLPSELPRPMDAPAQHTSRGYHLPAGLPLDMIVPGTSGRVDGRAAPISEFVVGKENDLLYVRHLRSQARAPLLSVMQNQLYHWCDQVPPLPLPTAAYEPRLRFGSTILRRRTWRFSAEELKPFVEAASAADALVAAARLGRDHRLPRRLFVKSSEEPKPIFVDLESVLSVELFFKLARKAQWIRCSEMVPDGENLWMEVNGQLRTSELRLTYVFKV